MIWIPWHLMAPRLLGPLAVLLTGRKVCFVTLDINVRRGHVLHRLCERLPGTARCFLLSIKLIGLNFVI